MTLAEGAILSRSLPLSGLSILIAEDAYLIAMEAQSTVEEAGADRTIVVGKTEDLRSVLARREKIDVCVLDLKLGDEDATPLIREIVEIGIPVLVTTGFDSVEPSPDVQVLRKPYNDTELVEAIRSVCRRD